MPTLWIREQQAPCRNLVLAAVGLAGGARWQNQNVIYDLCFMARPRIVGTLKGPAPSSDLWFLKYGGAASCLYSRHQQPSNLLTSQLALIQQRFGDRI